MFADLFHSHKDLRFLSRAVEMQQRSPVWKWILHFEPRAIPARPLVVVPIGINRVAGVETMRQRDGLPGDIVGGLVTAPDFPSATEVALIKSPAVIKLPARLCGCKAGPGQQNSKDQIFKPHTPRR